MKLFCHQCSALRLQTSDSVILCFGQGAVHPERDGAAVMPAGENQTFETRHDGPAAPARPKEVTTGGEFPSQEQLKGMGDLCFLFLRSPNAKSLSVDGLRRTLEPAVDNGYMAIMRQDGVPRAAITWAFLSEETEARFLALEPLASKDWNTGNRLWLMDVIAPYGQGSAAKMIRYWHDSLQPDAREYRFVRPGKMPGAARTYVARRLNSGRFGSQMTLHRQTQLATPETKVI